MTATNSPSLFHAWPLVALALCAGGLVVRALAMRETHTARLALRRARRVFGGGRLLTAGLILLLVGHLAGLLFPHAILAWNRAPARLYLLEAAGVGVGLVALAAWIRAASRQLRPTYAPVVVELAESVFLAMMFLAIGSGLGMAVVHRWGSSWGIATLRPYVLSIAAGDPRSVLVDRLPFLVRAHLFATFAAAAVFPLTRLALLPILLVGRAAAVCARPVAWVARTGSAALWDRCTALLWNEPQYRWLIKPASAAEEALAAARASWGDRPLPPYFANALVGERAAVPSAKDSTARKARR